MKKLRMVSLVLVLVIAFGITLSGCGSDNTAQSDSQSSSIQASSSTAPTEALKRNPVTLTAIINKDWNNDAMSNVFKRYEQQTGNKIDLQITPGGQPFNDAIAAKSAANGLPDLVFYYGTSSFITSIKGDEKFLDITNEPFVSKISPAITNIKSYLRVNGEIYGIPVGSVNVAGAIYNKKVFAANNVQIPKTWDEFLAACETFKKANVIPVFEAVKDGWPAIVFHLIAVADLTKDNPSIWEQVNTGKYDLTKSPEFTKALTLQRQLFEMGYYNKDIASATYDSEIAAVAEGKAAMCFNEDWAMPTIVNKYPDSKENVGMFPVPVIDNAIVPFSDPWGLYVTKDNANAEVAKGFLAFFTSDENLNAYYGELKGAPCYTGIKCEFNPGTADLVPYLDSGKCTPFYTAFITPGLNITVDYNGMATGTKTVEKALDEAQKTLVKSGRDSKIAGY